MKKQKILLLLALLTAVFFAVVYYHNAPARSLDRMLHQLSSGQLTKAEKRTQEGTLNINTSNRYARSFYRSMFSSLHYTIGEVRSNGNLAQVEVSITMIDMNELITDVSLETLDSTFQSFWGRSQKFYSALTDRIQSGPVTYETRTVTVYLVRERRWLVRKWRVDLSKSEDFVYAITGGVGELIGY